MSSDIRQAIDRVNAGFVAGFNRGDFAAACAVYTENARIMPPGLPTIEGRPAIHEFWAGAAEAMGIKEVKLETVDLESDGDMASELGSWALAGESGPLDNGSYVVVWKREADGSWKWHLDIWNSDNS